MEEANSLRVTESDFQKWPHFHQAGLYFSDCFKALRDSPTSEKTNAFNQKKSEGTQHFIKAEYELALENYEEALSVFRWVEDTPEGFLLRSYSATPEVKDCLLAAYLNIAFCNIKLERWKEAILACDEVLKIDNKNIKALYRKAVALTLPAGSDFSDFKEAVGLLSTASKADPKNNAVKQKLTEYKKFIADQTQKSRNLVSLFNYESKETTLNEIDDMISKAKAMISNFEACNKLDEAKRIKKKLKEMKKCKKDMLKYQTNFDKHSQMLKVQASKFGIDLSDAVMKTELAKAKHKGLDLLPKFPRYKQPKEKDFWVYIVLVSVFATLFYLFYNYLN